MCSAPALPLALGITALQNPRDFTFKQAWHYSSIHSSKLLLLTIILQTAKQEIFSVTDTKYVILISIFSTLERCWVLLFQMLQQRVWFAAGRNYSYISCKQVFFTKGLMFKSFKIKDACKKTKSNQNKKKIKTQENQTKPEVSKSFLSTS